jgi:4'-phosphopantetheinyl transferase
MVHVWAWDYQCSGEDLYQFIAHLSSDEQVRMQGFRFEQDRTRYAVSHAILRILLGRYRGVLPSSIAFDRNECGKPGLVPDLGLPEIAFNLSHTTRIGILAVAAGLVVGADVEEVRPVEAGTAEKYFSARELAALKTLNSEDWLQGFYNCWTRKEAIVKAEGVGLHARLDAFDVSLAPHQGAALLEVRADAGIHSGWHLAELRPALGCVGALATNTAPASITCYRFAGQLADI